MKRLVRSGGRRRPLLRLTGVLLLMGLFASGACSDSPSGPGTLDGRVLGGTASLGAAVLEIHGAGVEGVSSAAGTRVFGAPVPGEAGVWRVVVVAEEAGELRFQVKVADVAALPSATVVSAADGSNAPVASMEGLQVRLSR